MDNLFREQAKTIRVYMAKETETDPFEHTKSQSYLNPIPVKAIVSTVAPKKLSWKFYGLKVVEAKELIIEQKYLNLIRMSYKIEIDGTDFHSYKAKTANFTIFALNDKYSRVVLWRIE